MIKAELNYNPYLLETTIKFNGQEPRINSLVEKFTEGSLQDWVRRIPDIFYDEMNGYDFELEFSGTELDYHEVVDAFRRKDISEDLVRIFHKNELDGRKEKSHLIDKLMTWLLQNRNRNFDFEEFKGENADLFDSSYAYIIFQGGQLSTKSIEDKDISAEHVDSIDELKDTDLKNTPILMYLSKDNINTFQKNLRSFMERADVEHSQLFFLIHPSLDIGKVERIIKDLGIAEPSIVSDVYDEQIQKYIEVYPVSEYIFSVVSLFEQITEKLAKQLESESEKCEIVNREVHVLIDQYEDSIRRLKETHHKFVNRDNLEVPAEWNKNEEELLESIRFWRKRKTKITNEDEAGVVADEFETEAKRFYAQFLEKMSDAAKAAKKKIDDTYERWYRNAEFDANYHVCCVPFELPEFANDIMVTDTLKQIVEEEYVQPKEDIFGLFFKASNDTPKEPVLQKTYYYQSWRDYVTSVVIPKEKEVSQLLFEIIREYEEKIAEAYIIHLETLIEEQTKLKDKEAAKLSDEEKLLQDDMDWLVMIQDQLKVIERG